MLENDRDKNVGELECEDIIMKDKKRFGRVRTGVMRQLRSSYGNEVADKALSRINKRLSDGSLRIKDHIKPYNYEKYI